MSETNTHANYLRDLGDALLDLVTTMDAQQSEDSDPDHPFFTGAFFAYRRMFDVVIDQARAFGLSNADLGLPDTVDWEKLNPPKGKTS